MASSKRYHLLEPIASGGMGSVHIGRALGDGGFKRTVAIKKLHPHMAKDPELVAMLLDEAHLASRIHHPSVCSTLDVVRDGADVMVVMDYVPGLSLATLLARSASRGEPIPLPVCLGIATSILDGLHAAHEARAEDGTPLGIVHRDVSPQNVMLGADGVAKIVDFGVAKALRRSQTTKDGRVKGKLSYMAPEQLRGDGVDRRVDVHALGIVLWEMLCGRTLVPRDEPAAVAAVLGSDAYASPRSIRHDVPSAIEAVVVRALCKDPGARFATALEMAEALEAAMPAAPARQIARWAHDLAASEMDRATSRLANVEAGAPTSPAPSDDPTVSSFERRSLDAPSPPLGLVDEPRPKSRAPVVLGFSVLGALTLGLATLVATRLSVGSTANAAPPVAPVTASAEASARPSPSTIEPSAPQVSAAPSSAVSAPSSAPRKVAPSACVPPYFRDRDGVKHFKPECL